jgi:hypothetical protein
MTHIFELLLFHTYVCQYSRDLVTNAMHIRMQKESAAGSSSGLFGGGTGGLGDGSSFS